MRRSLLREGKIGSYLTYALGEIVLVVIGILIALAINNYQQERSLQTKEQVYLSGLKNEFEVNKLKIEELIRVNRSNYESATAILSAIKYDTTALSEVEFSRLNFQAFAYGVSYKPNTSVLTEMINSGSLKDLSDRELRIDLTNWLAQLESVKGQELSVSEQSNAVYDLFRESSDFSLRTFFDLSEQTPQTVGLPPRKFRQSNMKLLESTRYENILILYVVFSRSLEQVFYRPFLDTTEEILKEIDKGIAE